MLDDAGRWPPYKFVGHPQEMCADPSLIDKTTAASLFGIIFADCMNHRDLDRSPNGIANKAGLRIGPSVNLGLKLSRVVTVDERVRRRWRRS